MSLIENKSEQQRHIRGWSPIVTGVLGCCAIQGIHNFPADNYIKLVEEEASKTIKDKVAVIEDRARQGGQSILMATVNTTQKLTRQALIEAGWIASDWAVRPSTSSYETRVSVLHKFVNTSERESKV